MNQPENKTHAAERLLIGSIMKVGRFDNVADLAQDSVERLTPDHFVCYPCRVLFIALSELRRENQPITPESVLIHLERSGTSAELGIDPKGFISDLATEAGYGSQLSYALGSVLDESRRRELHHVGLNIVSNCQQPNGTTSDMIAEAYSKLFALESRSDGANEPSSAATMANRYRERLDAMSMPGWRPDSMCSGLGRLDYTLNFRPGQLVVIGARPSVGKSAVLLRLANGFVENGYPTLFFSLEMSEQEHMDRAISQMTGVPIDKLTGKRKLDDESAGLVADALRSFGKSKFWMADKDTPTSAQIASKSRRYARKHGVRVVVIDYLQLVAPANPKDARYLQVGEVARTLKAFAQRESLLVVCAAQLNRESEHRPNTTPRLSDLRDSGEVEQHASAVALLSRPEPHAETLMIDIAKNRGGQTDSWLMDFDRSRMRFTERTI